MKNDIENCQQGFVEKRSTASNLVSFMDFVVEEVENRRQVVVIYFDFKKAFDSEHRDVLLKKLHTHGVQGMMLKWIESYLSARSFRVRVDGCLSSVFLVTSGVP